MAILLGRFPGVSRTRPPAAMGNCRRYSSKRVEKLRSDLRPETDPADPRSVVRRLHLASGLSVRKYGAFLRRLLQGRGICRRGACSLFALVEVTQSGCGAGANVEFA